MDTCKKCNGVNYSIVATPNTVHYAKWVCDTCGRFRKWATMEQYIDAQHVKNERPPVISCKYCNSTDLVTHSGTWGPHTSKLMCATCGKFVKWAKS